MTRLKRLLSIGLLTAVSTFLSVGNIQAESDYGGNINNFCQDSDMY
jgi:hypothetical protein